MIRICIGDASSNIEFFQCDMALADFAHVLTGRSNVAIDYEPRGLSLVGTKAENKTELVPFRPHDHHKERQTARLDDHEARTRSVALALKPFEVDGWSASISDMWNGHRTRPGGQLVAFFRHVDAKTGKPIL